MKIFYFLLIIIALGVVVYSFWIMYYFIIIQFNPPYTILPDGTEEYYSMDIENLFFALILSVISAVIIGVSIKNINKK